MTKKRRKHPSKYYRWKYRKVPLDRPGSQGQPEAARTRKPRRRITDGLIALSSALVLSIYALGYLHTHDAVDPVLTSGANQPSLATAAAHRSGAPPAGSHPAATPAEAGGTYRDGTYLGRGNSRHGGIEATVVVQDGKIASAAISACMTRYSCRYMNSLVQEVIVGQAVPVDHVSGATDSSKAYTEAIQAALAQAI